MKEIRVEFEVDDFPRDMKFSYANWKRWVIRRLKDAGVPIIGSSDMYGLKSGNLSRMDDPKHYGKYVYVWKDGSS